MDKSYFKQFTSPDIDIFQTEGKHFDKHYERRTIASFLDTKLKFAFSNRQLLQFTPAHSSQASHIIFNTTLQKLPSFSDLFFVVQENEDKGYTPVGLVPYDHLQSIHKHHSVGPLKAAPHRTRIKSSHFSPIHLDHFPLTLSMQDPGKMLSTFMKKELKKDELLQKECQENEQPYAPNELVLYLQSNSGPDLQKRFTDSIRSCIRRMNSRKTELVPYLKCTARYKPEKKKRGRSSSGDDSEQRKKEARKEKMKQKKNQGLVDAEYGYLVPLSFSSDDIAFCDCCLSITKHMPDDEDQDSVPQQSPQMEGCQVLANAVYPIEEGFLLASQYGRIDATWLIESFKRKMMTKDVPRPTFLVPSKSKDKRKEEKKSETKQENREKKRSDTIRKRGTVADPVDDPTQPPAVKTLEKQPDIERKESDDGEDEQKRDKTEERKARRERKKEKRKDNDEDPNEEDIPLKPATFDLAQLTLHHYCLKRKNKGYVLVRSDTSGKTAPGIDMGNDENLEEADSKEEGIEVTKNKDGQLMIRDESGKLRRIHIHQKEGKPIITGMTKRQQAAWKEKEEQRKQLERDEARAIRENDDKTVRFTVEWLWQQLAQPASIVQNTHTAETADCRAHFDGTVVAQHAKWMNQIRLDQWSVKNEVAGVWGIEDLKESMQLDEKGTKTNRRKKTSKEEEDTTQKIYPHVFNLTTNKFEAVEFSSDSSCDSSEDEMYKEAVRIIRNRLDSQISKEDVDEQTKRVEETMRVLMERGASDLSEIGSDNDESSENLDDSEDEELRKMEKAQKEMNGQEEGGEKAVQKERKGLRINHKNEEDWLFDYELNSGCSEDDILPTSSIAQQLDTLISNTSKRFSTHQKKSFGLTEVVDGMGRLHFGGDRRAYESSETAKEETNRLAVIRSQITAEEMEFLHTVDDEDQPKHAGMVLFDHPLWMWNHAAISETVTGVMNDLIEQMRADREVVLKRTESLRPPPPQPKPKSVVSRRSSLRRGSGYSGRSVSPSSSSSSPPGPKFSSSFITPLPSISSPPLTTQHFHSHPSVKASLPLPPLVILGSAQFTFIPSDTHQQTKGISMREALHRSIPFQSRQSKHSSPTPKSGASSPTPLNSTSPADPQTNSSEPPKQQSMSLLNNTNATTGSLLPFPKFLAPAFFHSFDSLGFMLSFIPCIVEEKQEERNSEDERREKRRKEKAERSEQRRREKEEKRRKKEEEKRLRKIEAARARGEPIPDELEPPPQQTAPSSPTQPEDPPAPDLPPNSLQTDMDAFMMTVRGEASGLQIYVSLAKQKRKMIKYLERRGKRARKRRRRNARRRIALTMVEQEMMGQQEIMMGMERREVEGERPVAIFDDRDNG
ncbi:hypothetical protein BLNAU_18608 [Blattamonas nauphoetae]|uniref:Uncharacterized protein n=1 Tax=Blattamonas nauphoetae TaxID=2049346 RepID=A0ABQ9X4D9_9EUKA|nr:hypothetical protein BLNAU_18608 [Blattamonas nauphoetae]